MVPPEPFSWTHLSWSKVYTASLQQHTDCDVVGGARPQDVPVVRHTGSNDSRLGSAVSQVQPKALSHASVRPVVHSNGVRYCNGRVDCQVGECELEG